MKKYMVLALFTALAFFVTGCTKAPDLSITPSIKLDRIEKDGVILYQSNITTGIRNDNSQRALTAVKGMVVVSDSAGSIFEVPFTIDAVLPFATEAIEKAVPLNESQAKRLTVILKKSFDELQKEGSLQSLFLEEGIVTMNNIDYSTRDIVKLLKERSSK